MVTLMITLPKTNDKYLISLLILVQRFRCRSRESTQQKQNTEQRF